MKKKLSIIISLCFVYVALHGQVLSGYEYWFDNNYNKRVFVEQTGNLISLDLDVSNLQEGMHLFNFHAKDTSGVWGIPCSKNFFNLGTKSPKYEYWFDNNYENRKQGTVPENGFLALDIETDALSRGIHYFCFVTKYGDNSIGQSYTQYFLKLDQSEEKDKISQYCYWFDNEVPDTINIDPVNPLEWTDKWIDVPRFPLPENLPDDIKLTRYYPEDSIKPKETNNVWLKLSLKQEHTFHLCFKTNTGIWTKDEPNQFSDESSRVFCAEPLAVNGVNQITKQTDTQMQAHYIDATEETLCFRSDQPCRLAVFSEEGIRLSVLEPEMLLAGVRIRVPQIGRYYILLDKVVNDDSSDPKKQVKLVCVTDPLPDVINVPEAGNLPDLLSFTEHEEIKWLVLSGKLNGTDILLIRSLPNLAKLDISNAHIVEGGDIYYENSRINEMTGEIIYNDYRTADEVTGDYMFSDLPKLTRLVLSNTTITLGKKALYGCTGLTELSIPHSITTFGEKAIGGTQGNLLLIHWNTPAAIASSTFDTPEEMGNCLIYALQETECTYDGNVIINGLADKIRLTDAKGFRCPTAFKAKDISYTRTFSMTSGNKEAAAGWESIALPFDVQTFSHAEKGELAPFNSGKKGTHPFWLAELSTEEGFRHVTELKANIPYIISMPNSDAYEEEFNIYGNVTFHAENDNGVEVRSTYSSAIVRSEGPQFTLVPAYETVWQHDSVYVINRTISNGNLPGGAFVRNLRNANPFEAYAVSKDSPNQAPAYYSIGTNGSLTGLESLLRRAEESLKVYSIGRTLYIETNRAITLPIYDREGRTVRIIKASEGRTEITDLLDGIYFSGGKKVMIGK